VRACGALVIDVRVHRVRVSLSAYACISNVLTHGVCVCVRCRDVYRTRIACLCALIYVCICACDEYTLCMCA
jgi:hypothetical protein